MKIDTQVAHTFCQKIEPEYITVPSRFYCSKPSERLPEGCPFFDKSILCPPEQNSILDLISPPIYMFGFFSYVYQPEDLEDREICGLYHKSEDIEEQLDQQIAEFVDQHNNFIAFPLPLAMGVKITKTLKKACAYPAQVAEGQTQIFKYIPHCALGGLPIWLKEA